MRYAQFSTSEKRVIDEIDGMFIKAKYMNRQQFVTILGFLINKYKAKKQEARGIK